MLGDVPPSNERRMADGHTAMTRYLLIWLSMQLMDETSVVPVRRQIEDLVREPREDVAIDVWLESPGGNAHSAYKLALMLRAAASKIRVVVPDYAKSAATLLALVGDEIFMAPGAELGPLDGQMPDEGSLAGSISALNIARAADDVARDAVDLAAAGGALLLNVTGLARAQTLDAMLRFSASFSEPLVRQLDPRLVHDAKQTLRVTTQYAERLLTKNLPRHQASDIASSLVEQFPTHGFVISFDEARGLGLPVRPMTDYDLWEQARTTHREAEDGHETINFCRYSDDTREEETDDGVNDEVQTTDHDADERNRRAGDD
jgi:Serine dehydrogenase proteinase